MSGLLRLLALGRKAAEAVSTAAFAAMFVLFIAGVVMRYAFGQPLQWSDELITVIFIWIVFVTEALVITEREQITFDAIYDILGERARRIVVAAASLIIAGLFLAALPTIVDYVRFLYRERTSALQWRLDIVYACFAVYWCAVIVRAIAKLVRLLGRDWRSEVEVTPDHATNLIG